MTGRRRWRGKAEFELPQTYKKALMIICPGQEQQQGRRFRVIMEKAAACLDQLVIINASDLSVHNFIHLLPGDIAAKGAKALADLRGQDWLDMNMAAISETMGQKCQVIGMDEITSDPTFQTRSELIRSIYEQGNNDVSAWFDMSLAGHAETRAPRFTRKGVMLNEQAAHETGLNYLCDEYALRALMWEKWKWPEIYLGLAVRRADFFERLNSNPDLDLTIPQNYEIRLREYQSIHNKKLGYADQMIPLDKAA